MEQGPSSARVFSFLPFIAILCIFVFCVFQGSGLARPHKYALSDFFQFASFYELEGDEVPFYEQLQVKITNKYIERDGDPSWAYPWLQSHNTKEQIVLAEPYRESTLFLTEIDGTPITSSSVDFEWILCSPDGKVETFDAIFALDIVFEDLGEYMVYIKQYGGPDRKELSTTNLKVLVKYVRREIRSLTDEDLEETLDTMITLWNVPQKDGEELFGPEYKSMDELLKVHLKLAGAPECDHIHDGMGFLPHHVALSMVFEKSLQAVNPKVALPYWDFGIDYTIIKSNGGGESDFHNFINNEILNEKYFGGTDRETHYIKDGRWKELKVPTIDYLTEEEKKTVPYNSFGHMRAPWSSNPDPHMIRSSDMCGIISSKHYRVADCQSFYALYHKSTLEDYAEYVSYNPHGPIHMFIGGSINCEDAYNKLYAHFPPDVAKNLTAQAFDFHKNLYRWGILDCPEGKEFCLCPDLDEYLLSEEGQEIFFKALWTNWYNRYDFSLEQLRALAEVVCNSHLVDGDEMQASSSYSPEFWPVHPTLERAYQWKVLSNPFEEFTWPKNGDGTYMEYKVDICYGHRSDDLVLGGMLPLNVGKMEQITNEMYFGIMDPNNDVLTYVYDNFDWDYCDGQGYSMN